MQKIESLCKVLGVKSKKPKQFVWALKVVPPGIEPGTQGFSVLCSTN